MGPLPAVAPLVWAIVVGGGDVLAEKIWRPVDPVASHVEAESHRGIGVEGRDHLYNGEWLRELPLQISTCGRLAGRSDLSSD